MGNPLKDRAPPAELARIGQVIDLKEDLSRFERLAGVVEDDFRTHLPGEIPSNWRQSPVAIRLRFDWADVQQKCPAAEGSVVATLPAVCQRCLEPFDMTLEVPLKLIFADSGNRASEGDQYETWELEGNSISPSDVVEEALIMAMPLAAMHEAGAGCGAREEDSGTGITDTVRPFADLKSLMRDGD